MRRISLALLFSFAAGTAAQAQEMSLTKLIASDLAQRRGMIAMQDSGVGSVGLAGRYSSPACRAKLVKAIKKGQPLSFGLFEDPPTIPEGGVTTTTEETYHLDKDFTSRNKASLSLLAAVWNVKASAAADIIRKSNISFKVYRKGYPGSKISMSKITGDPEQTLLNGAPPSGTVSAPYEILFVSDFNYTRTANTGGGLSIAAEATEKAKGELSVAVQKDSNGKILLPDKSAVAFKPVVVWDRPKCKD